MHELSLKRESYLFQNTLPWNSLSSPSILLVTLQMDQTILFSSIHPFTHYSNTKMCGPHFVPKVR